MRLCSEAGILFVEKNKQLDLTEMGKSQLVFPLCKLANKMVVKKMLTQTRLQPAENK